jgi:protein-disulfide isomerase
VAEIIAGNQALAQSLAINGTPAFIIDTHVTPGYLPAGELLAAIQGVRGTGGCKLC